MNIHCVLHIETFWFPCSSRLGEGEQPQNRGTVIPVWRDEMVLRHLYLHICQTSKLEPNCHSFKFFTHSDDFYKKFGNPTPPSPQPKKKVCQ